MNLKPEGIVEHLPPRRPEAPAISVILPTYNRAAMLGPSVASVLGQTERDLELIIVDDGSKDGTRELVEEFRRQDPRVGYLREQNLGLPRALNNGFRVARGEFWTWTSDDNRYLPEALECLARILRQRPGAAIAYADMLLRRREGLLCLPPRYPENRWANNVFGAIFLYRATLARQAGEYDPALRMVEDYDFLLRVSRLGEVVHWPYILYEYGDHEGSLTNTRQLEHLRALARMLAKQRQLGGARRRELSDLAIQAAGVSRRRGQCWTGLGLALQAVGLWPLNPRAYGSAALALAACVAQGGRNRPLTPPPTPPT